MKQVLTALKNAKNESAPNALTPKQRLEKIKQSSDRVILDGIFANNTFDDLLKNEQSNLLDEAIKRFIPEPKDKTYGEIFKELYEYLCVHRRNEYFYLNTLFNLFFGFDKKTKNAKK
jgi:hypothetical protein